MITGSNEITRKNLRVLSNQEDDAPWIVAEDEKGQKYIMDRETFEYSQGRLPGTDPLQADLVNITRTITRARVLSCGIYRGQAMVPEVVIDTTDPAALAELKSSLTIVENPQTQNRCACLGGPTIELFAGQEIAATIGLQHGQSIRWQKWKHDAPLLDGDRLTTWLTDHGFDPDLLGLIEHNQYNNSRGSFTTFPQIGVPLSRAEQRLRIAENLDRRNDLDGALTECDKALAMTPGLPLAYAFRGLLRFKQCSWTECLQDCTEAIRGGFRNSDVYWRRAVAYDNLGQSSLALADCTTALEITPNSAQAYNSRGLIYLRAGAVEDAMTDLTEAIRLAPEWGLPYLNRSNIHLLRNDPDAAILDCTQAIECEGRSKSPADRIIVASALWKRGQAYAMKGDNAQAEADAQEAQRLRPDIASVVGRGLLPLDPKRIRFNSSPSTARK